MVGCITVPRDSNLYPIVVFEETYYFYSTIGQTIDSWLPTRPWIIFVQTIFSFFFPFFNCLQPHYTNNSRDTTLVIIRL